jgi:hypothetical protein
MRARDEEWAGNISLKMVAVWSSEKQAQSVSEICHTFLSVKLLKCLII